MRIGMILDTTFPPDLRVENEALSLVQAGFEVYLFSLDMEQRREEADYKGIRVVRYPMSRMLYKLSALAYTIPAYHNRVGSMIRHFIQRYRIEALHVHDMVIAQAAVNVNRSFGIPLVLDLHENRPAIMRDYRHVNRWTGKLLINLKRWTKKYYELAASADFVVVVTGAAREDLIGSGVPAEKIIVVPNTVRISAFVGETVNKEITGRMNGSFNVIYIGDTSLRRGTDTAIEAVAIAKDKIPGVRLWMVGKSSADGELRQLVKRLGVEEYVHFEGWRHPSLLASYLHGAHIALSPLKRNPHHDTTFANKLFQYMGVGVPVVVSDCAAQEEVVRQERCGLVFRAGSSADLAEKIIYLREHADEAEQMGNNGRAAVAERWNWDRTVTDLPALYRAIKAGQTIS